MDMVETHLSKNDFQLDSLRTLNDLMKKTSETLTAQFT